MQATDKPGGVTYLYCLAPDYAASYAKKKAVSPSTVAAQGRTTECQT